jgi:hypothetical protein
MNVTLNFNGISDNEQVRRIALQAFRTAFREWQDRLRSDRFSLLHD